MASLEQQVIKALDSIGIPYEIINIDPQFSDTTTFCERYGYPSNKTCNTIIVVSKRGPKKSAACVVLANTRLDVNKRVKELLNVGKTSFAPSEEMSEITGMEVGGVTPISLPSDLPLYVDGKIMNLDWVILGGGSRSIKIKISPGIFAKLRAQVIEGLATS
jgi:prolyl-tRNA editing enzyme YbaK/EbsC (Cys-tRNA(Pro) deacylase)